MRPTSDEIRFGNYTSFDIQAEVVADAKRRRHELGMRGRRINDHQPAPPARLPKAPADTRPIVSGGARSDGYWKSV